MGFDEKKKGPKEISELARYLAHRCNEQQQFYTKRSQEYGYAKDIFTNVSSSVVSSQEDALWLKAYDALETIGEAIIQDRRESSGVKFDVSSAAYAFGNATFATASTISTTNTNQNISHFQLATYPPNWTSQRIESYAVRIEKIDDELGKVMRSTWQLFYGGSEESERAALLSMRQLYDHFFSVIAPDDAVRNSEYFTPKQDKTPNRVHRDERLRYAARIRVPDRTVGDTLVAQSGYVMSLYERLNMLHNRGPINRSEALSALSSMQTILEEWLDALNL